MIFPYEVTYLDREGKRRTYATYGTDALAVTNSASELLQPGYRVIKVRKSDGFDW